MGFEFILSTENKTNISNDDKLWLNTEYINKNDQIILIDKWLSSVRFADK